MGQSGLAAPVRSHERGNLPVLDSEIEIIEDLAPPDGNIEVFDFEHDFSSTKYPGPEHSSPWLPARIFASPIAISLAPFLLIFGRNPISTGTTCRIAGSCVS